ncbi:MAG: choice-of-anchor V domain-containing protein [Blastocatellia bacterium]
MQNKLLKLSIFGLFCVMVAIYGFDGSPADAFSSGSVPSRTNAPGEPNCTACHGGSAINSGGGTLTITGLPANYSPNQEITVTVRISQSGRSKFGFQLTALDDQGKKAGNLIVTDTSRTQLSEGTAGGNLRQYINHTSGGSAANGANQSTWSFTWKAPAQSAGRVTFHAAGNAANNNGGNSGDFIYTTSAGLQPGATLGAFAGVSAASFSRPGTTAADAIVAGFGAGLSQNTVAATSIPLPAQLDGVEVEVKDAAGAGRKADLFFVSPGQINYLVPAGTVNGAATVTVKRSGNAVAEGAMNIDSTEPGLFSANANGQGAPAAVLFRRRNNVDTFEPVAQLDPQTNRFEPIQLDLGPEGDLAALTAFGTGFRAAPQSLVTCTIGGTAAQVIFSGPQGALAGLDQANILIPRSLAGRGLVDVVLTVGGKTANIVRINIR